MTTDEAIAAFLVAKIEPNRLANLTGRNVENIRHKLSVAFDLDGLRYGLSPDIAALQNGVTEFNTRMNYDVRCYRRPRRPFNGLALRIKNYIIPKRLHDHRRHFVVLGPQVVHEHQSVSQRYLRNDLAFVCFKHRSGSEWMRVFERILRFVHDGPNLIQANASLHETSDESKLHKVRKTDSGFAADSAKLIVNHGVLLARVTLYPNPNGMLAARRQALCLAVATASETLIELGT